MTESPPTGQVMTRGAPTRVVILGAAGRDFHDFNVAYREDPGVEVVAFTAAQIPGIAGRRYPPELAGPRYPDGLPIVGEEELERVIRERRVGQVVFAYSDVSAKRRWSTSRERRRALVRGTSRGPLSPSSSGQKAVPGGGSGAGKAALKGGA